MLDMELLNTYSSEESDSEVNLLRERSPITSDINTEVSCNIDYFNLEKSDSDEESGPIVGKGHIINSFDLVQASKKLNEEVFGPRLPNNNAFGIKERDGELLKLNVVNTFADTGCNRGMITKRSLEDVTLVENENVRTRNSCNKCRKMQQYIAVRDSCIENCNLNISDTEVPSEIGHDEDLLEKKPIYYNHPKISHYISNRKHCQLPKHKLKFFKAHSRTVTALCWCIPQYSYLLLSASVDSTVKVWDIFQSVPACVIQEKSGIKVAKWTLCGTKIIYGGYGKNTKIFDVNAGKEISSLAFENYVSTIAVHPENHDLFLVGTKNKILLFDRRKKGSTPIRKFCSNCQYILDIAFIKEGKELISSTEIVSRDSADRTLMAWDVSAGIILSNQIYHERYTCPSVKEEPGGIYFVAQTNGDYIVKFSTDKPYKMENMRYAGHKVSGYGINCDFSSDGNFLVSGDAEGDIYIYDEIYGKLLRKLNVHPGVPTVRVCCHPVLYSTVAVGCWDGSVHIWQ